MLQKPIATAIGTRCETRIAARRGTSSARKEMMLTPPRRNPSCRTTRNRLHRRRQRGSAGCVLANRLTEQPDVSVMLLRPGRRIQLLINAWLFAYPLKGHN